MGHSTNSSDEVGLGAFDTTYAIVGELRGSMLRRTFLATRRIDGAEAFISVMSATGAGENNALSHFASDTKILSRTRHAGVVQPIEAKWLGSGALAVVSERPRGTSLRQAIAAGEQFTNARIATLLQDVNGILEWARDQGIVHRGVTLDSVFVDPMSGRLQLSLLPTPIASDGVPGSLADAATIGKLAWALLAGKPVDAAELKESLASPRPDLARRVVEAVDQMRAPPGAGEHPQVADFLSIVATADVLKAAEIELEHQRVEYAELLQAQRENAAAERAGYERHAREMEEQLKIERREFERDVSRQRAALASERAQLIAEREQLAYEVGSYKHRRTSDRPDVIPPEGLDDLEWPDVDRRAHPGRFVRPLLFAASLIVAALAIHFAEPGGSMPSEVAVGGRTVIPTPPTVDETGIPRGGFLIQSAGGTLAPRRARPASIAAVAPDSSSRGAAVQHDSVERLRRNFVRDSVANRDTSLHRDSLGFLRPDTLPFR